MEPRPGLTDRNAATLKRAANDLMRNTLINLIAEEPFFCECDDPACTTAVWLSRQDYDRLRAQPGWRPLVAGHRSRGEAA